MVSCLQNKTEAMLVKWLIDWYGMGNIKPQKTFPDCRNEATGRLLPLDTSIEHIKVITELDGGQHFTQVMHWNPPEVTRSRDVLKMQKAIEHGYKVIRISQNDLRSKPKEWKAALKLVLDSSDLPDITYLSSDPHLYDAHKAEMAASLTVENFVDPIVNS